MLGASGGIAQLVKGVCEHMFSLYPEHEFYVFATPFNRGLLESKGENVKYFGLPLLGYFNRIDEILSSQNIDVLFRSYPTEDTLKFPLRRQIYLIPDIQHEHYPEFFDEAALKARRAAFAKALGESGAVGTISEFARQTLIDFPDTRCQDIFLMEPALQDVHKSADQYSLTDLEKQSIPSGNYFIFPANLWKHKNHESLLKAFELFINRRSPSITLVLTGHQSGWDELSKKFPTLPVRHLGFVSPGLLRTLLENSQALLFFSLYEGFGIPLLEAFDAGVPVLCSNTTSLPEVGGDAVLSCDPLDIEAIADLMASILENPDLRADLIQRGKKRLDLYSWDKSAHSLIAACERVCIRSQAPIELVEQSSAEPSLPLISIVTPSFNQGRFLKRTIDSVLDQDYPNLEYFVFDGGSTDESVDILKSYGDQFFWVSEPDRGQTNAINKGMKIAKGEILAYLNSDDVLLPGTLHKIAQFFKQNPDCDLVYGDAFYIDENDNVIGKYRTDDYSLNRLAQDCMICQPAAFWRRQVTNKIGLFDESLNYAMDYDYWLRLGSQGGRIYFLPDTLASSRIYPETKTKSARSKIYQEIFQVSRKNVGYVHSSYYEGYWHHLVYENNTTLSKVMRKYPWLYKRTHRLHSKWANYYNDPDKRTFGFARRKIANQIKQIFDFKNPILLIPFRGSKKGDSVGRVRGFWYDGWLTPVLTIRPSNRRLEDKFYLEGRVPVDTKMTVYCDGSIIAEYQITANRDQRFTLPLDCIENQQIKIKFSRHIVVGSRQLSFLLQETNLFSEQDLYS